MLLSIIIPKVIFQFADVIYIPPSSDVIYSPLLRRTLLLHPLTSSYVGSLTIHMQIKRQYDRRVLHFNTMYYNLSHLLLFRMEERN